MLVRARYRTCDRWCVNAFDQHLYRLGRLIVYAYVPLSGVMPSDPSTDLQAVRVRLGTLLAHNGGFVGGHVSTFYRQALGRVRHVRMPSAPLIIGRILGRIATQVSASELD
jgi:hypothetical protein